MINEQDLIDKYILSRWCYAISESTISDMEYNSLDKQMKELGLAEEYTNRAWSDDPCPVDLLERLNRMDLYRNISIRYGSESIASLRTDSEVRVRFGSLAEKSRLSFKVDGWNNQINYYNGGQISSNTRGRDTNPIDAYTIMSVVPKSISMSGRVKVIGEASIPNALWEEFKLEYGGSDQRASMSTVLAKGLSRYVSFKAFNIVSPDNELPSDKYSLLAEWGFETPKFIYVSSYQQLLNGINMMGKMNERLDVKTDGLVIENEHTQLAIRVGAWQEQDILTYVTGYVENQTAYGISMTLKVRPVNVNGKVVSILDVTNISQLVKNNLAIGSPVAFAIRSSANPAINMTRTLQLQDEYADRYEDFRANIEYEQSLIK